MLAEEIGLRPMSPTSRIWLVPQEEPPSFFQRHLPWLAPVAALVCIVVLLNFIWSSSPRATISCRRRRRTWRRLAQRTWHAKSSAEWRKNGRVGKQRTGYRPSQRAARRDSTRTETRPDRSRRRPRRRVASRGGSSPAGPTSPPGKAGAGRRHVAAGRGIAPAEIEPASLRRLANPCRNGRGC